MADFTFYGGLYRNVNVIATSETHFDLEYYGALGIMVTPIVEGKDAKVDVLEYMQKINAISNNSFGTPLDAFFYQ